MKETARIIVHNDQPGPMLDRLNKVAPWADAVSCDSYTGMTKLVRDFRPDIVYSVRFDGTPGYPRDALLGKDGPEWISVGGSGTDHLGRWDRGRVTVTNSAGVAAAMMAEYVLGCALFFTLGLKGLEEDRKDRTWQPRRMTPLRGKTMLIVGLGHTGQAIARRARTFGMTVIGTRARPARMKDIDEVHGPGALPDLWGRADVIAVCVPLLPGTRNLIGAEAFAAMKTGVILADVSRGGVVEEKALVDAVRSGRIGGAALDVFETEPLPPENEIWSLENVIISPHCSSVFDGWDMASFEMFVENLERWRTGDDLLNVVDPGRGY